ncbi:thermonuclease family protein [Thiobacillus denitrificans]|uniref:thermonuclease family protein n=1 Tax=Thiobacillus denitrificans TaxID=36861 RepID=UPI001EDA58DB|nr:thermonuclease family protein [Thiobacillus denitrificans]
MLRQDRLQGECLAAYPLRVLALRAVLALCLLFALAAAAGAAPVAGVVFVVIDGDTVLFKPDHSSPGSRAFLKLRLADIDAPEQDQPHGKAATRALSALLLNQRVEADTVAIDTYGRTIARIRVGAVRVNQEMVRRGLAWASTRGGDHHDLLALQREARRQRIGLWQDAAPTPPWAWRRAQSEPAS